MVFHFMCKMLIHKSTTIIDLVKQLGTASQISEAIVQRGNVTNIKEAVVLAKSIAEEGFLVDAISVSHVTHFFSMSDFSSDC